MNDLKGNLLIYNSLTGKKEKFVPLEEGNVRMYVCGPTVYNYIHIGNARSVVSFDVIRRFLEYVGYKVIYVSNFTDIDEKIIKRARDEDTTADVISSRYIKQFFEDVGRINVKRASYNPRVSEYIDEIDDFINELIDKGFSYEEGGDVYFRVLKSEGYGNLTNINRMN